jgi:hypothetical protein
MPYDVLRSQCISRMSGRVKGEDESVGWIGREGERVPVSRQEHEKVPEVGLAITYEDGRGIDDRLRGRL